MPRKKPAAWLLLALATLWPPAGEARPPGGPASGQYDSLFLAVRDGEVSGVFSEARMGNGAGDAPQFSCSFQLRGRLEDGRGIVTTWYPGGDAIVGNLSFEGGGVSLILRDNQDGCLMATGDMTRQPYHASLGRPGGDWIGVTLVTAARAVLHPAPEASPRRTPYVVDGDAVAVLERRAGWTRVRYLAGEKPATGWVRAAELAPETPPRGVCAAAVDIRRRTTARIGRNVMIATRDFNAALPLALPPKAGKQSEWRTDPRAWA